MKFIHLLCYGCIFGVFFPSTAFAYLDPAAGSSLIAIIAGGFTGLIVVFKLWKAKLRIWFMERRKATNNESESESNNENSSDQD